MISQKRRYIAKYLRPWTGNDWNPGSSVNHVYEIHETRIKICVFLQVLEWGGMSLVDRSFEEVLQITERGDDVIELVVEHAGDT